MDIIYKISIITQLFLAGFCIVMPVVAIVKTTSPKTSKTKALFIIQAVQILRVAGILYFIIQIAISGTEYFDQVSYTQHAVLGVAHEIPGMYWLYTLSSAFFYLVLSQCFWFKKVYQKKGLLILFSILLFILPSQRFIFFLMMFHRDYLPSTWYMSQGGIVLHYIYDIVAFCLITLLFMFITGKFKTLRNAETSQGSK